jgi:hypothetical protein
MGTVGGGGAARVSVVEMSWATPVRLLVSGLASPGDTHPIDRSNGKFLLIE